MTRWRSMRAEKRVRMTEERLWSISREMSHQARAETSWTSEVPK